MGCTDCIVFSALCSVVCVTANHTWELFVNKLLNDVYTDVCVCVTVMKRIMTSDFVIYIVDILTNAVY